MKKKYSHYLPKGWTLDDVQKVASFYDNQTDAESAAEIENAEPAEAVVVVPQELLPRIRKIIADNQRTKSKRQKPRRVA
jgi:hypothetical protein